MNSLTAKFFTRLQAAGFYRESHAAAVAMLPPGREAVWWDVGCGPGLVARLAAGQGYRVTAVDADPAMLVAARRHPEATRVRGAYHQGHLASLAAQARHGAAAVVSAASLLAVLDDPGQGLRDLLACVQPDGHLLLIETTPRMTLAGAWRYLLRHRFGSGGAYLLLWGLVRRGRSVLPDVASTLADHPAVAQVQQLDLLDGLLRASLIKRQA